MTPADPHPESDRPLDRLEEWDEFLVERYPPGGSSDRATSTAESSFQAVDPLKTREQFRDYESNARPSVREFYRLNHRYQTHEFALAKRREYLTLDRREMGIWEAAEYLNQLVDDSDPDTDLSQLEHLLQTAEQMRADGRPPWFVLAGFVHDLGKILCLWDEPQWAVVGDTFPTGCRYSPKIVFAEFFEDNPDSSDPRFQSEFGVYEPGCGLDQVVLSWGHDEYIYQVTKNYLPIEAQYMLRYHSFYPWHKEGEYESLTNAADRELLSWVREFNPYDLYTKSHTRPDVAALRPYYESLIAEYFPAKIRW